MTVPLRLIKGRNGWWALSGRHAARLPNESVRPALPVFDDLAVHDRERGLALTGDALAALTTADFFVPDPDDNYAVTVLTATACNLGCNYCFQNTSLASPGSFAPPRIKKAVLDQARVEATVAFVAQQMGTAGLNSTSVLLFGGEPLLNVPGCVGLLDGLEPLNLVDAEIVTNGVLLNPDTVTALRAAGLRRVQISFDGDRAAHDRTRVTRNGRPTYDDILRNIRASSASVPDLSWNLRVNVSHHNVATLFNLLQDLADAVQESEQVTLHMALIDDNGLGYENAVGHDDDLAETFIDLNRFAIRAGMTVPPSKPLSVCPYCSVMGGSRGAVINADGHLFSCWESVGRAGWDIGHVDSGYATPSLVRDRWVACDFDTKSHGSPEATRRFLDRVDAAALDDQAELGRLPQKALV